ncbi:Stress response protein nst1 [Irineochytrium annulatum]|nr:Stress response protein nst1 [Irineochytrium annulatum]
MVIPSPNAMQGHHQQPNDPATDGKGKKKKNKGKRMSHVDGDYGDDAVYEGANGHAAGAASTHHAHTHHQHHHSHAHAHTHAHHAYGNSHHAHNHTHHAATPPPHPTTIRDRVLATSAAAEILSDDDDDFLDDVEGIGASAKKKRGKKKKKGAVVQGTVQQVVQPLQQAPDIWFKSDAEEKQRIREFWLQLGETERRALVKLEKEAVLRKMKEQQKQTCACSVCGRKRTVIEEELEILYDAYYEELENFAHDQTRNPTTGGSIMNPRVSVQAIEHRPRPASRQSYESDEDEIERNSVNSENIFEFGSSLEPKEGGILTVADDFLKNDGKKFLDLMEQLAERKIRLLEEEDMSNASSNGGGNQDWDDGYDDEEYEDEDDEEDSMTEEQRMEEGRRMFQIFAAKMFEQRVLTAYREKVAHERQLRLLQELEEEKLQEDLKEEARQKVKEKKKEKKKAVKQQREEEKQAKERERMVEEERLKAEREKKLEEERLRREAEKQKREEERLRREEAERIKREAERLKKEAERLKQREAEERKQKAREERERAEREKREKETKAREAKEAAERAAREEAKAREAEHRAAESKAAAEREAERKAKEEKLAEKVANQRAQALALKAAYQQQQQQQQHSPTGPITPSSASPQSQPHQPKVGAISPSTATSPPVQLPRVTTPQRTTVAPAVAISQAPTPTPRPSGPSMALLQPQHPQQPQQPPHQQLPPRVPMAYPTTVQQIQQQAPYSMTGRPPGMNVRPVAPAMPLQFSQPPPGITAPRPMVQTTMAPHQLQPPRPVLTTGAPSVVQNVAQPLVSPTKQVPELLQQHSPLAHAPQMQPQQPSPQMQVPPLQQPQHYPLHMQQHAPLNVFSQTTSPSTGNLDTQQSAMAPIMAPGLYGNVGMVGAGLAWGPSDASMLHPHLHMPQPLPGQLQQPQQSQQPSQSLLNPSPPPNSVTGAAATPTDALSMDAPAKPKAPAPIGTGKARPTPIGRPSGASTNLAASPASSAFGPGVFGFGALGGEDGGFGSDLFDTWRQPAKADKPSTGSAPVSQSARMNGVLGASAAMGTGGMVRPHPTGFPPASVNGVNPFGPDPPVTTSTNSANLTNNARLYETRGIWGDSPIGNAVAGGYGYSNFGATAGLFASPPGINGQLPTRASSPPPSVLGLNGKPAGGRPQGAPGGVGGQQPGGFQGTNGGWNTGRYF